MHQSVVLLCLAAGVAGLSDLVSFPVGVGVAAGSEARSFLTITQKQTTLKAYFNQLTPGNIMKMSYLHPAVNTYTYTEADAMVSWAASQGMSVHGHTFIWHEAYQVPSWMTSYTGDFATMLNTHVTTIATHFKGKLKSWDVVNEVLDSSQSSCYRNSLFYQKVGKAFISNAFKAAYAADASAILYYNDYDIEASSAKLACLTTMLDDLIANKVPIHGVGFQMHVYLDYPSVSTIKTAFKAVVSRGLRVKISEMDVPVNNPYSTTAAFPQYTSFTSAASALQKARYKAIIAAYLEVVPAAQRGGITFWDIWDGDSWLMELSAWNGADDWPCLFTGSEDGPYVPKDAFYGVQEALQTLVTPAPAGFVEGTYHIISKYSGQYVEVVNALTTAGANVQVYPNNNYGNQRWTFTSVGSGYYKIINELSGMAMDVSGSSTANGANVLQWTYKASYNQHWSLSDQGNGYYAIINRNSGKALDLAGPSTASATNVQQYTWANAANQMWLLKS